MKKSIMDRLMAKVVKAPDGCWLFTGSKRHAEYGAINIAGKPRQAHRTSYEVHVGPIPANLNVLHRCDVPACVNPDHLFVGTLRDNSRDSVAKGRNRSPRGEAHHLAKLTREDAAAIRKNALGKSQRALARQYGVHGRTIANIVRGITWKPSNAERTI